MTRTSSKLENRGTRLGFGLFRWRLWREMSPLGRALWLGLYGSAEARRFPLAIWEGDVGQMARACALKRADVETGLAELAGLGAVEFEEVDETIVLRLVELPDRCEGAFSPSIVQSWWTRFTTLPPCGVRDRHIATLYWLCQTDNGQVPPKVLEAWQSSFGALTAGRTGEGAGEGPPEGVREGGGESTEEGEVSSSLPDPDRTHVASRVITNRARDPGAPVLAVVPVAAAPADPLAARDAEALADLEAHAPGIADLAKRALARYGPRHAPEVPEGCSALSGSYR